MSCSGRSVCRLGFGLRDGAQVGAVRPLQLGALGLILSTITLWNTVYLDHAIGHLRTTGYPVLDADVARLSPYMRRISTSTAATPSPPPTSRASDGALRDPDAPDEDWETSIASRDSAGNRLFPARSRRIWSIY